MKIDDHCGTVTPVVSLPQDSVMVLVSKPLPMAWRTGGSAASPIPAPVPAATTTWYSWKKTFCFSANRFRMSKQAETFGRNHNECVRYGNRRTSEYGNGGLRFPSFNPAIWLGA